MPKHSNKKKHRRAQSVYRKPVYVSSRKPEQIASSAFTNNLPVLNHLHIAGSRSPPYVKRFGLFYTRTGAYHMGDKV